jgi:hypothetical protein
MEPGDILRRSWEVYRAHPRHLITIAALVYVPLGAAVAALSLAGWPGLVAGSVLNLAGLFLVQGALVKAVEDVRDGRVDLAVAETFGHAAARLKQLVAAGLLATIGITIGFAFLIIPGLILLTWWLVVVPVIMLEHRGVLESFGRSRQLVRGNAWPVFGVVVLTILVLTAVGLVLGILLFPLGGLVGTLLQSAIGSSLTAPFAAVAWTLTYFRLRGIKEAVA